MKTIGGTVKTPAKHAPAIVNVCGLCSTSDATALDAHQSDHQSHGDNKEGHRNRHENSVM